MTRSVERALSMPGVQSAAFSSRVPLADAVPTSDVKLAGAPGPAVRSLMHSTGPGSLRNHRRPHRRGTRDQRTGPVEPSGRGDQRDPCGAAVREPLRSWSEDQCWALDGPGRGGSSRRGQAGSLQRARRERGSRSVPGLLGGDAAAALFVQTNEPADRIVPLLKAARPRGGSFRPRYRSTESPGCRTNSRAGLARPRFFLALVGTFGAVALVLAVAGLYGVMAFAVAQRRHEWASGWRSAPVRASCSRRSSGAAACWSLSASRSDCRPRSSRRAGCDRCSLASRHRIR